MSSTADDMVPSSGLTSKTQATAVMRPAGPADRAALGGFFAGLSAQTRYLRFFAPVTPAGALLRALSGGAGVDAVVAVRGGAIIGHAMAADRPATAGPRGPRTAGGRQELTVTEIGVVVADAWQGRGIGSALMRALVMRAQARGVTSMAMEVLHANHRVLAMIERRWPAAETSRFRESATIHIRLPRSDDSPPPRQIHRTMAGQAECTHVPALIWFRHAKWGRSAPRGRSGRVSRPPSVTMGRPRNCGKAPGPGVTGAANGPGDAQGRLAPGQAGLGAGCATEAAGEAS